MLKLKLKLDDLAVESFGTDNEMSVQGTIVGRSQQTWEYTCQNCPGNTDGQSCAGDCFNTYQYETQCCPVSIDATCRGGSCYPGHCITDGC